MKIVILTGSELRHNFVRKAMAMSQGIKVLRSYCEGQEKSLHKLLCDETGGADIRRSHLQARESCEVDFFGAANALLPDHSAPFHLEKGRINEPQYAEEISGLSPDILVAYGCSLIREPLLTRFKGRFLNVHLGLSPYYRGAGTNFWPLVAGRPEYVGATFMYIDAGIDTGEVIHQIRARVYPGDSPHQIGNRLIRDVAFVYSEIIRNFSQLAPMPQLHVAGQASVHKTMDFSEDSAQQLYAQFEAGLVERYLRERGERVAAVPIVENPLIRSVTELMNLSP